MWITFRTPSEPQPQDLEPGDRRPDEGAGTPAQPHAYGNHRLSLTRPASRSISGGSRRSAGARSSTTEWRVRSRLSARFARCSTTFCVPAPGASWWFRDARRGLAPQPASGVWSRLTARFARCSTTFPVPPTGQIRWFRDARWRSLLNHRAAWRGLDYPARCSTTEVNSGPPGWLLCGLAWTCWGRAVPDSGP